MKLAVPSSLCSQWRKLQKLIYSVQGVNHPHFGTLGILGKCLQLHGGFFFLFCPCPGYGINGVSSGDAEVVIKNHELHETAVLLCHRDKATYISGIPVTEISYPPSAVFIGEDLKFALLISFLAGLLRNFF